MRIAEGLSEVHDAMLRGSHRDQFTGRSHLKIRIRFCPKFLVKLVEVCVWIWSLILLFI